MPNRSASSAYRNVTFTSLQSHYARATRTPCIFSVHGVLSMHDATAALGSTHTYSHHCAQTSIAVLKTAGRRHACSEFNVQYKITAQSNVHDALKTWLATAHTSVRLDYQCCQGWYLARLQRSLTAPFCDDRNQRGRLNDRVSYAFSSTSHSHVFVYGSKSRARHAHPAVITRIAAVRVVLPAVVVAPSAAVGGDVQIHKCSPLVRSGGGHDTNLDRKPESREDNISSSAPRQS
jgi:hypothetical protein